MITREQFGRIDNCQESLDYVASQPFLADAWENCERSDWLLAFARKARIATKAQFVRVAIGEAEAVLHIWTAKYPDDDRPQKAIKAAKDWLGNPTSETRSAAAAAYATYAAYAAARDTAAAAAAASAVADDKEAFRRAQCDRIRAIIPNPFIDHEGDKQ